MSSWDLVLLAVTGAGVFLLGVQQGRVIERERLRRVFVRLIRDDPILRKYD